jgi:hypothetical protein
VDSEVSSMSESLESQGSWFGMTPRFNPLEPPIDLDSPYSSFTRRQHLSPQPRPFAFSEARIGQGTA